MACEFGITFYLIVKMSLITSQSESHIINFSRQSHECINGILYVLQFIKQKNYGRRMCGMIKNILLFSKFSMINFIVLSS